MRRCLLEPLPAHEFAANCLSDAADALIAGDRSLAEDCLRRADMPEIRKHVIRLVGVMSEEVHRSTRRPKPIPEKDRHPDRMPGAVAERCIFVRDGWRCRFCGMKVISRKSRNLLAVEFSDISRWEHPEYERHAALYAMASSLDHVVPHSRGGENHQDNFVTACYGCQFGRGEWLLEEVEILDPRKLQPMKDEWDGLVRIEPGIGSMHITK